MLEMLLLKLKIPVSVGKILPTDLTFSAPYSGVPPYIHGYMVGFCCDFARATKKWIYGGATKKSRYKKNLNKNVDISKSDFF